MPQITLEYTRNLQKNIDTKAFFIRLHQTIQQVSDATIEGCKSRAYVLDEYCIGHGKENSAYAGLVIRLLAGREVAMKQAIGESALALLKQFFLAADPPLRVFLTVEIRDMDPHAYFRYVRE